MSRRAFNRSGWGPPGRKASHNLKLGLYTDGETYADFANKRRWCLCSRIGRAA